MGASATDCPCGSGRTFAECCRPVHGGAPAASAEALMRARYSAYAIARPDVVLTTWHVATRPATLDADPPGLRWLGLKVLAHQVIDDAHAEVTFEARYRIGGASAQRLREHSRFVFEDGRWWYFDGDIDD